MNFLQLTSDSIWSQSRKWCNSLASRIVSFILADLHSGERVSTTCKDICDIIIWLKNINIIILLILIRYNDANDWSLPEIHQELEWLLFSLLLKAHTKDHEDFEMKTPTSILVLQTNLAHHQRSSQLPPLSILFKLELIRLINVSWLINRQIKSKILPSIVIL